MHKFIVNINIIYLLIYIKHDKDLINLHVIHVEWIRSIKSDIREFQHLI